MIYIPMSASLLTPSLEFEVAFLDTGTAYIGVTSKKELNLGASPVAFMAGIGAVPCTDFS